MIFSYFTEYASVGYMAKRIQMRKNRFLALQKMAEQKKNEAMNATNAAMNDGGPPDHHGMPKQTVRSDGPKKSRPKKSLSNEPKPSNPYLSHHHR